MRPATCHEAGLHEGNIRPLASEKVVGWGWRLGGPARLCCPAAVAGARASGPSRGTGSPTRERVHALRRRACSGARFTNKQALPASTLLQVPQCVDHILVLGETHLRRTLQSYALYYNRSRVHRALNKDAPFHRVIERLGAITSTPVLGGLHHQYCRI
jgi:hypothetical protein